MSIAGLNVVIRLDEEQAGRITRSWPYRRVVLPVRRRVARTTRGHAPPVFYPRMPQLPRETEAQRTLVDRVNAHDIWYHTIDLGQGVRTPGMFDHPPALRYYPLPERLDGWRCLDVATLDGFWAFEMERRGAAEVVALDIESWMDWDIPPHLRPAMRVRGAERPTGEGFRIASELLGSKVKRQICNVYELSPERVGGQYDLVMMGDLLIHLSDPHRAIQAVYSVVRPGGMALFVEPYLGALDRPEAPGLAQLVGSLYEVRWWEFSTSFLEKAVRAAGFSRVEFGAPADLRIRSAPDFPLPRLFIRAYRDDVSPTGAVANGAVAR